MITRSIIRVCLTAGIILLFSNFNTMAQRTTTNSIAQQRHELLNAVRGKRVGMLTNPAACAAPGDLDADFLAQSGETTITAFFAPEHGLRGDLPAGQKLDDEVDPKTGVPVYSLYGARRVPTPEQLANIDIMIADLQDVGVRFYTYTWTMTLVMEACAKAGKPVIVFDRPNPIGGLRVEGRPNTEDYGLIGRLGTDAEFGVATRHGMTVGEIATMWNEEWMSPKAELTVIKMPAWKRSWWWDDTGRSFVPPSPNMRSLPAATVYPGTCIFEGSNLSEGRGTDRPFEKIGAPFIKEKHYADALNELAMPGVRFKPIRFTPDTSKHEDTECGGVLIHITDREALDPIRTSMLMLQTACKLYPDDAKITTSAARLMGVPNLQTRLLNEEVDAIMAEWKPLQDRFIELRKKYLLYNE